MWIGAEVLFAVIAAAFLLPGLFGIRPMVVCSGSMEPSYPVGSLIYVRGCDANEVEAGDVITFRLSGGTVVTHRVVEKPEGLQYFRTKGDANQTPDEGMVPYENLIGKPIFMIPGLGFAAAYLGTASGRMIAIAAVILIHLAGRMLDALWD